MKNNNLFRKFLALFLTGTMLAGVGCKDYDDDIDDINKKIDDLNAKVELKADASALQTISDKLKDVDFSKFVTDAELSQELAAYVKDADLKKESRRPRVPDRDTGAGADQRPAKRSAGERTDQGSAQSR